MFDHIRAFYQPSSIPEAIRLLQKRGDRVCLVAGGTDLALRAGRDVATLVDISHLGLSYVKREGRGLRIGATTTMAEIEASAAVQRLADGILARAAGSCGGVQTRNMATIGGNLANASPAADTAMPLLVLDAEVVLQGLRSTRRVPLNDFFFAPHQTVANGSLLTEVLIPAPKPHTVFAFQRLGRTETDIAIVNAAVALQLDSKRRCTHVRIALGAVAPQPMRARLAEVVLSGQVLTCEIIERAAEAAMKEISPITDVRASAEYRREIGGVLVRRAIKECAQRMEVAL